MRRTLSMALVLSIITSTFPSAVLASETDRDDRSDVTDWSRVHKIAPATEVIVLVAGAAPLTRHFLDADPAGLTVLNLTDSNLPPTVHDVLRDTALNHPEYFERARTGETFVLEKRVRLQPDGVWLDTTRIGDLNDLVETIARTDVVAVNTAERHRNRVACLGAGYAGWFFGGFTGGMAGIAITYAAGGRSDSAGMAGIFIGLLVGGVAGATWLYRKCVNKPEETIYRAETTALDLPLYLSSSSAYQVTN